MNNARYNSLWLKGLTLFMDSIVLGLLGYALWLFLNYWWDYMTSRLGRTAREVWLSWDALNPLSYAHEGQDAILLFVCLVVVYFSFRGYIGPKRMEPDASTNASNSQVTVSTSEGQALKKRHPGKIAGSLDMAGGSLGFLMALLAWVALPLVDNSLNMYAAVLLAISSLVAVIGGSHALQGKNWGMALAGAVGATVVLWPLGLLALAFTILSREGFEGPQPSGQNA